MPAPHPTSLSIFFHRLYSITSLYFYFIPLPSLVTSPYHSFLSIYSSSSSSQPSNFFLYILIFPVLHPLICPIFPYSLPILFTLYPFSRTVFFLPFLSSLSYTFPLPFAYPSALSPIKSLNSQDRLEQEEGRARKMQHRNGSKYGEKKIYA